MSDYLTIKWGSGCTYSDIYYGDGYQDFIFILAKEADVIEPIYEVIKKEATEKVGRTLSPNKIARKTYKVTFRATESVCDTLNTIPLANSVIVQFPDDSIASLKGDDVLINITDPKHEKSGDYNHFMVELLLLTDVTIKKECCLPLDEIEEDSTAPVITSNAISGNTVILEGTAPDNMFLRGYYREFWQDVTGAVNVYKMSMYSKLGGWFIDGSKGVYKTTNGFVSATAKLTANVVLTNIKCLDENNIIAVGVEAYYISTDGGANWTEKIVGGITLTNLKIYSSTKVAMCGLAGKLYTSNDFGANIYLQTTGTVQDLYGIDIISILGFDTVLSVGKNGTVLKKVITDYTAANVFTLTTSGALTYTGFVWYGVNGYMCSDDGTVKKTIDFGVNWTDITTAYIKFNDICITKYGLLVVGIEDINIGTADAITQILDSNTTERTCCTSYQLLTDHSEYSCLGTKVVMNGNNSFVIGGYATSQQLVNNTMVITYPTASRTYISYIEAYINAFVGGSSSEILVKIP
jgi:hypothetical protein